MCGPVDYEVVIFVTRIYTALTRLLDIDCTYSLLLAQNCLRFKSGPLKLS